MTSGPRWVKRWSDARETNESAREREAVAAMASANEWPVLNDMEKKGHYPDALYEYAAAMPKGDWYGRPLTGRRGRRAATP